MIKVKLYDIIKTDSVENADITGVTSDSRSVKQGDVFVCIRGRSSDGHSFAREVLDKGACAVVTDHDMGLERQIVVSDTREAYALMCAAYFGRPADKMKLIGITGTNGKTTAAFLIKQILEHAGKKVGLIGTVQNMICSEVLPAKYTTPDPYELHSLFALMQRAGCEYVVMEVSSQALEQKRVYGLHFAEAVFTNFTQDHLDYHGTMENYFAAKKILFSMCGTAIINIDDAGGKRLAADISCPTFTYSLKSDNASFKAESTVLHADGVEYDIVHDGARAHINTRLPGEFSVYNSLAAASAASLCGMELSDIAAALSAADGVKGRLEVVPTGRDFTVIIDYAHTPDAIVNVCGALNRIKKGRLVLLFGCGGSRDKGKRPKMAQAAAQNSDFMIITSDNPRAEEPGDIIKDILAGLCDTATPYTVVEDRKEAIFYAVEHAQKDDIILLAGKGHETYQILKNDVVIELDERKITAQALDKYYRGR